MDTNYIVPFHKTGPRQRVVVGKFPAGNSVINLEPSFGFLHSYIIDTPSSVGRVRVVESNGMLIVDATPYTLNIITNDNELRIPFALDEKGLGALADMNPVNAYRMTIENAAEPGIVYADYWPPPAPVDALGRPQHGTPPYMGLVACINEIRDVRPDFDGGLPMFRTGNHIVFLALIVHENAFSAKLIWDNTVRASVVVNVPPIILIDARSQDEWQPTTVSTRLALRIRPLPESATWIIRDVFAP